MELIEDQNDADVRHELAEVDRGAASGARRTWIIAAAAAAGIGVLGWWVVAGRGAAPQPVAIAVPANGVDQARASLRAAGIAHEFRGGAFWVAEADVRRAIDAAASRPHANAVADTLADESVFASGESARARRTAATIRELEAAIAMQPGVERASVVLGEPSRTAAPGVQGGGSASVTVSMRAGTMPQDLVDAVAVLVSGACPGMRAESVAVVDARAGRVRTVRDSAARAQAESARGREERARALVSALIVDLPGAVVRVQEPAPGSSVATVEVPRSLAIARAEMEAGGDLDAYLRSERDRIASQLEPFAGGDLACTLAVQVVPAPEGSDEFVAVANPEQPYSAGIPAQARELAAAERERGMPLGSASAPAFPYAWAVVAVAGLAAFAWWTWRRPQLAVAGAGAEDELGVPDFDVEPLPGVEASDVVRAQPADSARAVGAWVAAGDADRAARLVVALEAGAAASLLKELPMEHVQQVTAALGAIDSPSREELADAVEAFMADLGTGPDERYRQRPEAP